jgi:hypothetical protein
MTILNRFVFLKSELSFRVHIYYCISGCNTYLLHRRPELKAVPENAWLILTGLLVIQSHWQRLYIGGHILLRLTNIWIMLTLQITIKFIMHFYSNPSIPKWLLSFECFVLHWYYQLKHMTLVTWLQWQHIYHKF